MSDDRRVKRTKKALKSSLLTLLCEKPVSKITIRELTELADINRGTFYLHYADIYALYCDIKTDFIQELTESVKPPMKSMYCYYLSLFQYLEKQTALFPMLSQDVSFMEEVEKTLQEQFIKSWKEKLPFCDSLYLDYFFSFLTAGSSGAVKKWCRTQNRLPPKSMAAMMAQFIESGSSLLNFNTLDSETNAIVFPKVPDQ